MPAFDNNKSIIALELHDMLEYGMIFKVNADYDRVIWYRNGPEETYSDRKHGAKLGIYRNKVLDNMANYLVTQECGNKKGELPGMTVGVQEPMKKIW